ncbi:protein FAM200A-like [Oncorhynchus keta]|uniref:protein FAM200A-like n=1 Tax=Oncorhynchus keta TaxID=8018 RepID=UPI00227B299D|nr:protein FAM200A-like [Oncorhynchus keta]XP_052350118.1 protein FAM200A-like [Oncorhynchus keta]XP_052350119.1 protein FAM200A-like [Oncorhynchus keta]
MSEDITCQTSEHISANGHYAQQLDESTDVAHHAILMVYVRHVWDNNFEEQFLFSADLPTTSTAGTIFNTMDMHMGSVGLAWDGCVGVTTAADGAAAMMGKHSGVVKRILERAQSATWNHCFLHREALAAKDMVPELQATLQDVIKCVNYIKKSSTKSRCFQAFCGDMRSEYQQVFPGLL